MLISIRNILGLGDVPADRTSATQWLKRKSISILEGHGNGGRTCLVNLSDLPEPVRIAYTERQIAASGLASGTYDDAA